MKLTKLARGISTSQKSFEERVNEAIKLTGLPTEIAATKILTENHWSVENEYPYVDVENGRVRTLDIRASMPIPKKSDSSPMRFHSPDALNCELYIECKKSDKPWVFYLDTMTHAALLFKISRLAGNIITTSFNTALDAFGKKLDSKVVNEGKIPESILTKIPTELGSCGSKIALSHQILFVKEKIETADSNKNAQRSRLLVEEDKDEIYSAEMQIFKALNYQENKDNQNTAMQNPKKVIVPIILLNGNMFGCFYKNDELKTPRIQYTRHLAHGLPYQQIPALLDVVTLEYFPEYVKLITKQLSGMN